jgi:hypothetical protein
MFKQHPYNMCSTQKPRQVAEHVLESGILLDRLSDSSEKKSILVKKIHIAVFSEPERFLK